MQKTLVLEANEISPKVFRTYAKVRPGSAIARLLVEGVFLSTQAQDVPESFLYPSQSWASLNTGVAYDQHKIHWYNDPKPDAYPMYWRTAARSGKTVGLVNTLHSSPWNPEYEEAGYAFVVPDCFTAEITTKPAYLSRFQDFNLQATRDNGRVASSKVPWKSGLKFSLSALKSGIQFKTPLYALTTIGGIAAKRVSKERLRFLQFPLLADIFFKHVQAHRPDLSILFTNHVAATMHRYLYAMFPEDYPNEVYGADWRRRHGDEVFASMDLLDDTVQRAARFCSQQNVRLVITTSMGQGANQTLPERVDQKRTHDNRLEDASRWVRVIMGSEWAFEVESAMKPQYTLMFTDENQARSFVGELEAKSGDLPDLELRWDRNQNKVTLTTKVLDNKTEVRVGDATVGALDLGYEIFPITDHHSGRHIPEGSLLIYNSKSVMTQNESVDYLEFAPAMLESLGITPPSYMKTPSFRL